MEPFTPPSARGRVGRVPGRRPRRLSGRTRPAARTLPPRPPDHRRSRSRSRPPVQGRGVRPRPGLTIRGTARVPRLPRRESRRAARLASADPRSQPRQLPPPLPRRRETNRPPGAAPWRTPDRGSRRARPDRARRDRHPSGGARPPRGGRRRVAAVRPGGHRLAAARWAIIRGDRPADRPNPGGCPPGLVARRPPVAQSPRRGPLTGRVAHVSSRQAQRSGRGPDR